MRHQRTRTNVACLAFALLCVAPAIARGQASRLAFRGEFGAGVMTFGDYQTQTLGYGLALQGSGRFGVSIVDAFAVQLSFTSWLFPAAQGDGQIYAIPLGFRFEPRVAHIARIFVDLNVGPGWTPNQWRIYADVGLGAEFAVSRWFWLGPVIRYGVLFHWGNDVPSDAQFISFGLSMAIRPAPARRHHAAQQPPPQRADHDSDRDRAQRDRDRDRERERERDEARSRDRDHDGVPDVDDHCPGEPDGRHPDPDRRGCPLPDADDDGVPDRDDRCPHEGAGHHPDSHRPGCPVGDSDHDGVPDDEDRCPDEPDGLHPDPNRPGCPMPDRDHDSVPDAEDACPTRPGAPSSNPRFNGCPGLVRIEMAQIRILQPVYFAPGREQILPRSEPLLRAIADAMRALPRIHRLSIHGHTDETGSSDANLDLSRRRADSVRDWLVNHGVSRDRLETRGYGETRPVIPGTSPRALAANRRVEFHIVDPVMR